MMMSCNGQDRDPQARAITLLLPPTPPPKPNNSPQIRSFVEKDMFGQRIEYSVMEQPASKKHVPESSTKSVVQESVTDAADDSASDCDVYQGSIATSSSPDAVLLICRPDPSDVCEVTLNAAADLDQESPWTVSSSDENELETDYSVGTIDISSSSEYDNPANMPFLLPIADILAAPQESFRVIYGCNSHRLPDDDRVKDHACKSVSVVLKRLDVSKLRNGIVDLRRYRNRHLLFLKPKKKGKQPVRKVNNAAAKDEDKIGQNLNVNVGEVLPRLRSTRARRKRDRWSP